MAARDVEHDRRSYVEQEPPPLFLYGRSVLPDPTHGNDRTLIAAAGAPTFTRSEFAFVSSVEFVEVGEPDI